MGEDSPKPVAGQHEQERISENLTPTTSFEVTRMTKTMNKTKENGTLVMESVHRLLNSTHASNMIQQTGHKSRVLHDPEKANYFWDMITQSGWVARVTYKKHFSYSPWMLQKKGDILGTKYTSQSY